MAVHQPNYSFVAQETRFDARVSELISRDVLQLAQDIGTTVLKSSTDKAVVFSPLSIFGVLSMLLMGSTGRTYDELMQLLRFNEGEWRCESIWSWCFIKIWISDLDLSQNSWKAHEEFSLLLEDIARDFPNPVHKRPQFWDGIRGPLPRRPQQHLGQNQTETLQKIAIGNGVFVQDGFSIRPSYRQAVESVYKSTLSNLDFRRQGAQAMQYMNEYVSHTHMRSYTNGEDHLVFIHFVFRSLLQLGEREDDGKNNEISGYTSAAGDQVGYCKCIVLQSTMGEHVPGRVHEKVSGSQSIACEEWICHYWLRRTDAVMANRLVVFQFDSKFY